MEYVDRYKDGKYYPNSMSMPEEWEPGVDWGGYLVNCGWKKIYDSDILETDIWYNEDENERFIVNVYLGYATRTILVNGFSELISLLTWLKPLLDMRLHENKQREE